MNRIFLAGIGLAILGLASSRAHAEYDNRNGSVYIPQAIKDILKGPKPPKELRYRLLILTETPRNGTAGNFATYDGFVKGEADETGSLVKGMTWNAIVSVGGSGSGLEAISRAVDDSASPVYGSTFQGVYGTDGSYLATDYRGLFNETNGVRNYNQFGHAEGAVLVWSGSYDNGTAYSTYYLGQSHGGFGFSPSTYTTWLRQPSPVPGQPNALSTSISMRFYGISDVILVPEPASIAMWLGFAGVAGVCFWRRRRRAS
ncbi:MAG: PEP-CTERM sorting domain-containing protein [Planctomycetes bacterium]|nr:PEP-CTERM sorting domain-containing protein [Planctomycetota bacterium]